MKKNGMMLPKDFILNGTIRIASVHLMESTLFSKLQQTVVVYTTITKELLVLCSWRCVTQSTIFCMWT